MSKAIVSYMLNHTFISKTINDKNIKQNLNVDFLRYLSKNILKMGKGKKLTFNKFDIIYENV